MSVKGRRGDTIIEVILAMTLLTLILFTSWGLVNRSTQASLAARQRIEMVNELKEQAEILKAKYAESQDNTEAFFSKFREAAADPSYDDEFCTESAASGGQTAANYFNDSANIQPDASKSMNGGSGYVWIEYEPNLPLYVDFYVRGCWLTTGGQQKTDNSQFIVRLNK